LAERTRNERFTAAGAAAPGRSPTRLFEPREDAEWNHLFRPWSESLLKGHHQKIKKGGNMHMNERERHEGLRREIESLRAELQERELSLPAHSTRPGQLLIIEELEEKIRGLEEKLKFFGSPGIGEGK
jgi:hypothetical protein